MSRDHELCETFLATDYSKRLLAAVTSLTAEMSQASSKDEVLDLVATWTPTIVPADRASVIFAIDHKVLKVFAFEGNKAIPLDLAMPVDNTTAGRAFLERRVVRTDDTSMRSEVDSQMLAGKGLTSVLNAPMICQGKVIGTLNVAHRQRALYTPEHETLILHVAGVVAAQMTLLDQFFATKSKLESVVAERTAELEVQKQRLEVALDKERKVNGLQRQFVSMVCHEFRTPLAIIDGSAQRLQRNATKLTHSRIDGACVKIRDSIARLIALMESVLSAARLEEGKIKFEPGECDLRNMIQELCENHRELNPSHQIIVDIERLPETIFADGKLLRQVYSNLLSNALKYSPPDTHIWVNGWQDDRGDALVSVKDEGIGIPKEECKHLFERFFRASTSTGIPGTGIGLHLVKHLVDMHRGALDVKSDENTGTMFTVTLPVN